MDRPVSMTTDLEAVKVKLSEIPLTRTVNTVSVNFDSDFEREGDKQ